MDVQQILLTVTVAISAGVLLILLAERLRVPAIAPLLVGGVLLGPEGLGLVRPSGLGALLSVIVSLAVAIILFEGGLNLSLAGYLKSPQIIRRLLSWGVIITWFGTAASVYMLFGLPIGFCVLAGSLVIVTGPTVINPLLRRVQVKERLHHILHWEGVLIDPIGVFIAVLCFEWYSLEENSFAPLAQFGLRVVVGAGMGAGFGLAMGMLLRFGWVAAESLNLFVLGLVMLCFGLCEQVADDSGILAVVVAGQLLTFLAPRKLEGIRKFKTELTHLGIGMLFILLAATLKLKEVAQFGWPGAVLIGIVLLLIRPINIFLCTWGRELSVRDRLFLSWIAPRGVVAASMAALFALVLEEKGHALEASFVQTFTYGVIAVSVLVQGLTAGLVARILGVQRPKPRNWIIVGAHSFARGLARFAQEECSVKCVLIDTNANAVEAALSEGLTAIHGDALNPDALSEEHLAEVGSVLALTDNSELNELTCQRWVEHLGTVHAFRWTDAEEEKKDAQRHGIAVWTQLPKPSVVARDLETGERRLVRRTEGNSSIGSETALSLACASIKVLTIGLPKELLAGSKILLLEGGKPKLERIVRAELVLRLEASSFEDLFPALVRKVVEAVPTIPREETQRGLLERERTFSTAVGRGVAIPHAYCKALRQPLCAVARIPTGVSWQSPDGLNVRLVFLLLSPPKMPDVHLGILAQIARLVQDEARVEQLIHADKPESVLELLRQAEAKAEGTGTFPAVNGG